MTGASEPREATVAVVLGGTTGEREVSLVSGEAVLTALRAAGTDGPREVRRIEIESGGLWNDGEGASSPLDVLARHADVDAFFLALHGGDGEGGRVQGLLSMAGHAFTGSGLAASALCLDKWNTRTVVEAAGLRVAPALLVARSDGGVDTARLAAFLKDSPDGVCVKPRRGGSSVLTAHDRTPEDAATTIAKILEDGDDALVERWTPGVEATSAVLGVGEERHALAPVEIRPHDGAFFDYEEKYSESGAEEFCPPRDIPADVCERIRRGGLAAHAALGCYGYSRSDFIVPEGAAPNAEPVFLETNTLPGMTPRSLFPLAALDAGISFEALCTTLIGHALARGAGGVS